MYGYGVTTEAVLTWDVVVVVVVFIDNEEAEYLGNIYSQARRQISSKLQTQTLYIHINLG